MIHIQIERVKNNENVETGIIYNIGIKLVKTKLWAPKKITCLVGVLF